MRCIKRIFIAFICAFVFFTSCDAKPFTTETRYLPKINALIVNGPIKIILNGSKKITYPTLQIPIADLNFIQVSTNNHVLTIQTRGLPQENKEPVMINAFSTWNINALNGAEINGNHLILNNLSLIMKDGNTQVNLDGQLKLKNIQLSDNSVCHLSGVNTDSFHLSAEGNSYLFLTGQAQQAFIHLQDHVNLDAKQLDIKTVLITAKNDALAHINPSLDLHAIAYDNAQVYFYHYLSHITRRANKHANVLKI